MVRALSLAALAMRAKPQARRLFCGAHTAGTSGRGARVPASSQTYAPPCIPTSPYASRRRLSSRGSVLLAAGHSVGSQQATFSYCARTSGTTCVRASPSLVSQTSGAASRIATRAWCRCPCRRARDTRRRAPARSAASRRLLGALVQTTSCSRSYHGKGARLCTCAGCQSAAHPAQ